MGELWYRQGHYTLINTIEMASLFTFTTLWVQADDGVLYYALT